MAPSITSGQYAKSGQSGAAQEDSRASGARPWQTPSAGRSALDSTNERSLARSRRIARDRPSLAWLPVAAITAPEHRYDGGTHSAAQPSASGPWARTKYRLRRAQLLALSRGADYFSGASQIIN